MSDEKIKNIPKTKGNLGINGNLAKKLDHFHSAITKGVVYFLAVCLLLFVFSEMRRDKIVFEPFSVPPELFDQGLNGRVAASHVSYMIREIRKRANRAIRTTNPESAIPTPKLAPELDLQLPGAEFSIREILNYVRRFFGIRQQLIVGDIQLRDRLYLTISITGRPAQTFDGVVGEPNELLWQAAIYVLKNLDPLTLALYYYYEEDDLEKLSELAYFLEEDHDSSETTAAAAAIMRGLVALQQDDFHEAKDRFERALALTPENFFAHLYLSRALTQLGLSQEALVVLERAGELEPDNETLYRYWAYILNNQGKYDEALEKIQRAAAMNPRVARVYLTWGFSLSRQKKYIAASEKFKLAVEIDPEFEPGYRNWGYNLIKQGKYDEALAKIKKAIALNPKKPANYDYWGRVLLARGNYATAVQKFKTALALDPRRARAHFNLAKTFQQLGRQREAIAHYEKTVQLKPQASYAPQARELARLLRGKIKE